jgi:hypothetical protein
LRLVAVASVVMIVVMVVHIVATAIIVGRHNRSGLDGNLRTSVAISLARNGDHICGQSGRNGDSLESSIDGINKNRVDVDVEGLAAPGTPPLDGSSTAIAGGNPSIDILASADGGCGVDRRALARLSKLVVSHNDVTEGGLARLHNDLMMMRLDQILVVRLSHASIARSGAAILSTADLRTSLHEGTGSSNLALGHDAIVKVSIVVATNENAILDRIQSTVPRNLDLSRANVRGLDTSHRFWARTDPD